MASVVGSFIVSAIVPLFGPLAGGNQIVLSGSGLQYGATSDYVQSGLIALYDGIDNTGDGDKFHSNTATTWKDLSGNNYDLTLSGSLSNVPWVNGNAWTIGSTAFFQRAKSQMALLPVANQNYTVEFVWNQESLSSTALNGGFLGWGCNSVVNQTNNTRFFGASNRFRHYWWGNDFDFIKPASANRIQNVSITYGNTVGRRGYSDGVYFGNNTATNKATCATGNFFVGKTTNNEFATGVQVFSVRIYNRALTDAEVAQNYAVDKKRFISLPQIKIGGKTCINTTILGADSVRCVVPAGTGTVNVTVSYDGATDVVVGSYTYGNMTTYTWMKDGQVISSWFINGTQVAHAWLAGVKIW